MRLPTVPLSAMSTLWWSSEDELRAMLAQLNARPLTPAARAVRAAVVRELAERHTPQEV